LSTYRHFVCNYSHVCSSNNFWYSTYFIKYFIWFNDRYPIFSGPFFLTHTCLCKLHSYRFVEKYMYPYFSTMMGITNNWSLSRFYLSRLNPSQFECLEAKSTKTNGITSSSYSLICPLCCLQNFVQLGL
jgi:hypothetical protein